LRYGQFSKALFDEFPGGFGLARTSKVYDFSMDKVEGRLVSYLKRRRNESTVADMIAGTGLPKYQVEQAAKVVLDEYAGNLKVTDSGELLYYFPSGMRSTVRGFGPSVKRVWKTFLKGAARVLSFLFKIWIVVMLVGYFLVFLLLMVAAILATFAASAAGGRDRDGRSRGRGDGFGATFLILRLLDFALRMWFWTSILQGPYAGRRQKPRGRPFYKSVFGFVFGDEDPNADWETTERTRVISYIRSQRGVITIEELMALTGRSSEEAQALINRYMLEFEGEPKVTDNGTILYSFPELLRTTEGEQRSFGTAMIGSGVVKKTAPFSSNKPKTNGWIAFFNSVNLVLGTFFLTYSLSPGAAALAAGTPTAHTTGYLANLYYIALGFLRSASINPVTLVAVVLGAIPLSFSVFFFLIPLVRKLRLNKKNQGIREENLRKKIYAGILESPLGVRPETFIPTDADSTPRQLETVRKAIIDRFAALKSAEPVQLPDGRFSYDFKELEREMADAREYRKNIDLKSFEVGKTVFDSGE
jgi:hypothetical protein